MKSSDLILAEFLDRCCAQYVREPMYRKTLRRELKRKHDMGSTTRRTAA